MTQKSTLGNKILFFGCTIIAFLSWLIVLLVTYFNLSLCIVHGDSMNPSLHNNEVLILQNTNDFKHGNLAVFDSNWSKNEKLFIKRIVAAPGDTVKIIGGDFYVNDQLIFSSKKENYDCVISSAVYKLTDKQLMVFGDNVHHSLDSRRVYCDGRTDFLVDTEKVVKTGKVLTNLG